MFEVEWDETFACIKWLAAGEGPRLLHSKTNRDQAGQCHLLFQSQSVRAFLQHCNIKVGTTLFYLVTKTLNPNFYLHDPVTGQYNLTLTQSPGMEGVLVGVIDHQSNKWVMCEIFTVSAWDCLVMMAQSDFPTGSGGSTLTPVERTQFPANSRTAHPQFW